MAYSHNEELQIEQWKWTNYTYIWQLHEYVTQKKPDTNEYVYYDLTSILLKKNQVKLILMFMGTCVHSKNGT